MNGNPALADRYRQVLERIRQAEAASGRPAGSVRLLAVSKTFPAADVLALAALGQRAFGENYLQEAEAKIAAVGAGATPVEWHFIGPIQSNKTGPIARAFDWVHSVEREKIAVRLSRERDAAAPGPRLNVCLQVNVSGEATKSGCDPAEVPALSRLVAGLPGLALRGLMAIPEPTTDPARMRDRFRQVRELFEAARADLRSPAFDTLSMGMSADLEAAVAEGATIVRVGSALFGARG